MSPAPQPRRRAGATAVGIAVFLLAAALPPGRTAAAPTWVTEGRSPEYPAERYLTGIGAASIEGDEGLALEKADARARSALAREIWSQVSSRTETATRELRRLGGRRPETVSYENLDDQIRITSQARLIGATRVATHTNHERKTVHVMVAVDLQELARRARQAAAPQLDTAAEIARWAAADDHGKAIYKLQEALEEWPPLDPAVRFALLAAPERVADLRAELPATEDAVAAIRDHLGKLEFRFTAGAPPERGAPVSYTVEHNAFGLLVRWHGRPVAPHKKTTVLPWGKIVLHVAHALPGPAGELELWATLADPPAALGPGPQVVARHTQAVPGRPATLGWAVRQQSCGFPEPELQRIVAACAQAGGFVATPLAEAAPALSERFDQGEDIADAALPETAAVDRLTTVSLTCRIAQQRGMAGYAYSTLSGHATVADRWLAVGAPPAWTDRVALNGAGMGEEEARASAADSLESELCGALERAGRRELR